MEQEINIAEILKDKPLDIKLWTDIFGEVTLDYVSKNGNGFNVKHHHGVLDKFLPNGKMYEEGTLCIYPSRNMRDWRKFAWKKGDVLVSNGEHIIFEKWANNAYTTFIGVFDSIDNNSLICLTSVWEKETNEVQINKYISQIEKAGGGKLNLSTLEIEKPQFKDGDIVVIEDNGFKALLIYKCKDECFMRGYVTIVIIDNEQDLKVDNTVNSLGRCVRPATYSEKQQLFDALAKGNKAWDAEKKAIVDLPKKCEFKPFDKVVVRHENEYYWGIDIFSNYGDEYHDKYQCLTDAYEQCLPYNDQTAHLLGTTEAMRKEVRNENNRQGNRTILVLCDF